MRVGRMAALAAALGLLAVPAGAAEINFLVWGGHYLDTFGPMAKDFEKETGVKVNLVVQSGAKDGLTKVTAQKSDPQVDVWASIDSTAAAAAENGLLLELDKSKLANAKDVPAEYFKKHYVTAYNSARGIVYRKDLVPFEIKDWNDLWDPRLKNKVGLSFVIDTASTLLMGALVNGGNEKNIEPGFEKMKQLKPNIAGFFKTDQESVKFIQSGEFAVIGYAILSNFYLDLGPESKIRFVMPEKPKFFASIPVAIVKGRRPEQQAAAYKFVDYLLSVPGQEWVTSRFGTVPVNPKAKLPKNLEGIIPEVPPRNVYDVDWDTVNANYAAWNDRWNKEIQTR